MTDETLTQLIWSMSFSAISLLTTFGLGGMAVYARRRSGAATMLIAVAAGSLLVRTLMNLVDALAFALLLEWMLASGWLELISLSNVLIGTALNVLMWSCLFAAVFVGRPSDRT